MINYIFQSYPEVDALWTSDKFNKMQVCEDIEMIN